MSFKDVGGTRGYQSGYQYGRGSGAAGNEYNQLAQQVGSQIQQMSASITQIQRISNMLGTKKDTHQLQTKLAKERDTTASLARDANRGLKQLAAIPCSDPREEDKRKTQQKKLKSDLEKQLKAFQQIQRNAKTTTQGLLSNQKKAVTGPGPGPAALHVDNDREETALLANRRKAELQMVDHELEYNESLILEREQAIVDIESTIQEVNEIFRDLAGIVQDQGEMLNNIDENIESAVANTKQGVSELTKANKYQKSARNKMCCLLLIVALVALAVAIPLAVRMH